MLRKLINYCVLILSTALMAIQPAYATSEKAASLDARWKKAEYLTTFNSSERVNYSSADVHCLAKNIYHEAGNQSRLGKIAVAQVTINRMKHPAFRNSICAVVYQPSQFSWTTSKKNRQYTPREAAHWRESLSIAQDTLANGLRIKGMEKALFFHATYVRPGWRGMIRIATIGDHVFYAKA